MAQSTPNIKTAVMEVDAVAAKNTVIGTDSTPANNPMLHRGGVAELEVVSGDDTTLEGTRSPNKVQVNVKNALIGTNVTLANNVKMHRGGAGELSFVLGDDSTTEGNRSTTNATIVAKNIILGNNVNQDNNIQIRRAGNAIVQFTQGSVNYADGSYSADSADILGGVPVGSIVAWNPGYYLDGSNGTFVNASFLPTNSVAGANSYLNPRGYYVADGSVPAVVGSPIWNAAGRYLPNLTDDRFLMGTTSAGAMGGSNTMLDHTHTHSLNMAHTHDMTHSHDAIGSNTSAAGIDTMITGITDATLGSNDINFVSGSVVEYSGNTGAASTDVVTGTIGSGSDASVTENRPQYLSVFYIVRVF